MLKRPSSRRKTKSQQIQLNLVPILDAMVTLIGFLLYTMAFIALVSVESPFPTASTEMNQEKFKEKPLQLTVSLSDKETEIWSPFEKIPAKKIPHTAAGEPDLKVIHEAMIGIKQQFPAEVRVVLVPFAQASYEMLVSVMDSVRLLEKSDTPIYRKNEQTGNDEVVKNLFPEIVFGNLLGDS